MKEKKHWIIKKNHKDGCDLAIVKSEKMPDPVVAADALGWDVDPGSDFKIITCSKVPDIDEFLKDKLGQLKHNKRPLSSSEVKSLGVILGNYEDKRLEEDDMVTGVQADMFNYDDKYIDIEVQEDLLSDDNKTHFSQVKLMRSWLHPNNLDSMDKILNSIEE